MESDPLLIPRAVDSAQELQTLVQDAEQAQVGPITNPVAAEELPRDEVDRQQAENLLISVFPSAIEEAAGVFGDLEVERFHSDHVAVVSDNAAGRPSGLLTSLLALRDEAANGTKEQVDLELEAAGDALLPTNPLVNVEIPSDLSEGVELSEAGVTISLVDHEARAASTVAGGAAFYPNVAEDSDLLILPTPTGVETLTQLRSPDAPTTQSFDLDIPSDSTLEETDDGGAVVVNNGEPVIVVRPPTAIDAEGASVPVTMEVNASTISLHVSPSTQSAYPILVDPLYESWEWMNYNAATGLYAEWLPASDDYYLQPTNWNNHTGKHGLNLWAGYGVVSPPAQASWNYYVPRYFSDFQSLQQRPTSFIRNMTLSQVYFIKDEPFTAVVNPHMTAGLWDFNKQAFSSVATNNGAQIPWTNATIYLKNDSEYTTVRNGGISMTTYEGVSYPRQGYVGQAVIELGDKDLPSWASLFGPSNWVNGAPWPLEYAAGDSGLGVHSIRINYPKVSGGSGQVATSYGCAGSASNPCPRSTGSAVKTLSYDPKQIAQGEAVITATAIDPIGNQSAARLAKVKVDHSSPTVDLTGSAVEQDTLGTRLSQYILNYSAKDGDDAAATWGLPIGKAGTGPGQLQRPMGVALDPSGSVFVVDRLNNRVVKYDPNGAYLTQFGTTGSGDGQFNDPRGIAVSPSGTVWVTDLGNRRIQEFTSGGQFIRAAAFNTGSQPYAITSGLDGVLWVTDIGLSRVVKLSESNLSYLGAVSGFGIKGGTSLVSPVGVSTDALGNVWVADNGTDKILQFDSSGQWKFQFGASGSADGQLSGPVGIDVSPSGNIAVMDRNNSRVQIFETDGRFLRKFGTSGVDNAQFMEASGLSFGPNNNLFIADSGNQRVTRWSHADQDPQSGAAKVAVKVDGALVKTEAPGCPSKNCSIAGSWTLNAEDYAVGSHKVEVVATDGVGLETTKTLNVETHGDLQAPAIALSGPMTEQAYLGTTRPTYRLRVKATDPGSTEERQSGVASTIIKVDGQTVDSASPGCTAGGCSLTREWTLNSNNYSVGSHAVEVKATDAAGRSTTKTLTIDIERDTTAPVFQSLGELYTAPSGWVEQKLYSYTANVSDENGYGLASVQLKIDGQVVKEQNGSCEEGGCGWTFGWWFLPKLDMSVYDGGAHPAELIATDGAGNKRKRTWTINVAPSGQINLSEAADTVEAVEVTAPQTIKLSPVDALVTEAIGEEGSNPQLVLDGSELVSEGTDTPTTVSLDPEGGFSLDTVAEGSGGIMHQEIIEISPGAVDPSAGDPEVTDGSAAVVPNSTTNVDSILRPAYDGLMTFQAIRAATGLETYSWEVALGEGEYLELIDSQHAGVFWDDGTQAMLITAQSAHDADGKAVETSIAVSEGNVITLTVHHRVPGTVYPVLAGVGWQGGFQTELASVFNPEEANANVSGEPAMFINVAPPIPAPTNEVGEDAKASATSERYKKNWGVNICAPISCGFWKNNFRGYFFYNYYEAWYPRNRNPKCTKATNLHFSIEITECAWVGPNDQVYGNGYHITARTQFQVTANHPDPVPDVTSSKAVTGRAYGSGNIYFHKTADICNPNTRC